MHPELTVPAGSWELLTSTSQDGARPDAAGPLTIRKVGPAMRSARPRWWVVSGWWREHEPGPVWVVAEIREDWLPAE